jgi:hypothetical protein
MASMSLLLPIAYLHDLQLAASEGVGRHEELLLEAVEQGQVQAVVGVLGLHHHDYLVRRG